MTQLPVGGPAATTYRVTSRAHVTGRVAVPAYLVTDGRAVEGGPSQQVYYVSDAEIAAGEFVVAGDVHPIPIVAVNNVYTEYPPIPIYVVNQSIAPSVQTYRQRVLNTQPASLIAFWPLGNLSGTSAPDISGNGLNGVANAGVTLLSPGIGDGENAATFNNGVVNCAAAVASFSKAVGSVSLWFKKSSWPGNDYRDAFMILVNGDNRIYIEDDFAPGTLILGAILNSVGQTVSIPISSTAWNHAAITWNHTKNIVRFYFNGAQMIANSTVGEFTGTPTITIGAQTPTPTGTWVGGIGNVALWGVDLTAAEVFSLAYVSTTNPNVVYGDSIVNGVAASPITNGCFGLVRAALGFDQLLNIALPGLTFKDDCETAAMRNTFVARVAESNPSSFLICIGRNDWAFNYWTAAAFGAAYADMLDKLHAALPTLPIYCHSPLRDNSQATPNAGGDNLAAYRSAIATASGARAWTTYIDGTSILDAADLADGTHPTTAGHAKWYAAIKSIYGL